MTRPSVRVEGPRSTQDKGRGRAPRRTAWRCTHPADLAGVVHGDDVGVVEGRRRCGTRGGTAPGTPRRRPVPGQDLDGDLPPEAAGARPRYTTPMPPRPSSRSMRYGPNVVPGVSATLSTVAMLYSFTDTHSPARSAPDLGDSAAPSRMGGGHGRGAGQRLGKSVEPGQGPDRIHRWSVVGGRWSVVGGRWSVVGGRCRIGLSAVRAYHRPPSAYQHRPRALVGSRVRTVVRPGHPGEVVHCDASSSRSPRSGWSAG